MTLTPLFFLPRRARAWAYRQAIYERLMDTPLVLLFITVDKLGIEFWYRGDTVIWMWPWKRDAGNKPFISLSFSATYPSLKAIDEEWEMFYVACNKASEMEEIDWESKL
jgi:hypothetical protein